MNSISLSMHLCGMCDRTYSERVKISMPNKSIRLYYDLDAPIFSEGIDSVKQFIEWLKKSNSDILNSFDSYCIERLVLENLYIECDGYFLSFKNDMPLIDLFNLLSTDYLKFHCFCVGGASERLLGYRVVMHSDESIHRFGKPHVHIEIDGFSPRYDLETFEMIPGDKYCHEHIRDKKKIKKYLKENQKRLINQWMFNIKGLVSPDETIDGVQILKES